jgi:hypothetical protein
LEGLAGVATEGDGAGTCAMWPTAASNAFIGRSCQLAPCRLHCCLGFTRKSDPSVGEVNMWLAF